jgi:hypothetical protein
VNWFPSPARSLPEEIKVNEIGGGLVIVTDDVLHQDVENVVVDRDCLAKTGHDRKLEGRKWKVEQCGR